MDKDKIISALIGLVGACNNNPKTENTDDVILKAIAFWPDDLGYDEKALQKIVNEIYEEKNAVAPGCAVCAMPCGNTSDYDMNRIYQAKDGIRKAKFAILTELKELASDSCRIKEKEGAMEIFYKALSYVSYDMEEKALLSLFHEIEELKEKVI